MPLVFLNPAALVIAGVMVVGIVAVALFRRPDMPRWSRILILVGLVLLSLAAGKLAYVQPEPRNIAVMVDLSPSTRVARYRDANYLQQRIRTLLGEHPYRIYCFSDEVRSEIAMDPLPDLPSLRTIFDPPLAPAVLLFSDARFELPDASPPTFIAVDPLLENPPDAAIRQMSIRQKSVAMTISNTSDKVRNLETPMARAIPPGSLVLSEAIANDSSLITARLNFVDEWPENDQLQIRVPPPILRERWWVGANPPAGFKTIESLPNDSSAYLTPSIVVLENTPASAFSQIHLDRLEQYVRDLGGALVISGGDHAFAVGEYVGTTLDVLSPLASSPPTPTIHWILLADASGSMSGRINAATRYDIARMSLSALLPHLPPEDPVSIGSFAEKLRWWSSGKSARETMFIVPPQIQPTGPTNLEPALVQIIAESQEGMPKELLILTDGDTKIENPAGLERGLKEKQIRLQLVLIGEGGSGVSLLRQISQNTGGQIVTSLDPREWSKATQKLFSMIGPVRLDPQGAEVRFIDVLKSLPARKVAPLNRTWIKKDATSLAENALAARWQVGSGSVAAFAFPANPAEIEKLAASMASPPRDPRFAVTWTQGSMLHVRVDAADGTGYLNDQALWLTRTDDTPGGLPTTDPIPQIAPGRYELSIVAPNVPTLASVSRGNAVLDRIAVAGRYPAEFDAIGNDRDAMEQLASATGGAVISPADNRPIALKFPARQRPLSSALAMAAFASIAMGLILWRVR